METRPCIISVSYNSAQLFLRHWQNLLTTSVCQVIIVDNASPDGSGSLLKQHFPRHEIVQMDRNLGYGRAANEGIKRCKTRYALLLNPDLFVSEAAITGLYLQAQQDTDNTAIWGPALRSADYSGDAPRGIDAICGAAMLFDLEKMATVGWFDENIFLYSEETDLCYRTRQLGYDIKYCPAVVMEHLGNSSSGSEPAIEYMKSWHFAWSKCYYLHKHDLLSRKMNPQRMLRNYLLKSFISLNMRQRLRYRGQAKGVGAFLRGESAFTNDGRPQLSPG